MTPRQYWGPKRGLKLNVKIHVSREVIFVSSQEHYNITVCYYTLQAFSDIEITEYIGQYWGPKELKVEFINITRL